MSAAPGQCLDTKHVRTSLDGTTKLLLDALLPCLRLTPCALAGRGSHAFALLTTGDRASSGRTPKQASKLRFGGGSSSSDGEGSKCQKGDDRGAVHVERTCLNEKPVKVDLCVGNVKLRFNL